MPDREDHHPLAPDANAGLGEFLPPPVPDVTSEDEAEAYLRRRRLVRWLSRGLILLFVALALAGVHLVWPLGEDFSLGWVAIGSMLLGLLAADFRFVQRDEPETVTEVVGHDLAKLEQCFTILQKQVGVTIRTSEHAVLEMVARLHRVHQRSNDLHQRIIEAVGRSQSLSQNSQQEAAGNRMTIQALADSQSAFVEARKQNQARIRNVVEQVRLLSPLTKLISDISQQTNLLAINASIEAARAGPEGAGFKVVAAEVRRLSTQTAEAASQISQGILSVAETIEGELSHASELDADGGAAAQLTEVATHIAQISAHLEEVVPYMVNLSGNMNSGMAEITTDIIDAMGHMQFQDINRQLLEQVESALGSLSEHSAALYALVGGKAPPPPQALEHLMERWVEGYVMEEQRRAHDEVRKIGTQQGRKGLSISPSEVSREVERAPELQLAGPEVPKIELF